jgi:hypothetical protein
MLEHLYDVLPALQLEAGHNRNEVLEKVCVVRLLGDVDNKLWSWF